MYIFNFGLNQNFNFETLPQMTFSLPVFNCPSFNTNFIFQTSFFNQLPMSQYKFFQPNNLSIYKSFYKSGNTYNTEGSEVKMVQKKISYDAQELKDTWKNKKPHLTNEFYNKIVEISKRLKCDPAELMGVMNSESGLIHTAVNKKSDATGLIQFMPATAKNLGTTVNKLKSMSAVEQLDYVEKYLKIQKKAAGFNDGDQLSAGELYALVFLPARAKNSVLTTQGETYYSWNKGLDRNRDGKITKHELDTRVRNDFMA